MESYLWHLKVMEWMKAAFGFLLVSTSIASSLARLKDKVETLIENNGYESKSYKVETQDGYILKVHHVKPPTNLKPINKLREKPLRPVFLMHGLGATSGDFLLLGRNRSLGFILADNGFDVYLGNARGNSYSLKHKTFSVESKEFWDFSFHEIGLFDLPAMIDFVLNRTRSENLFYVGHSQGTTSLSVLLSMRPEYNEKIRQAHLFSPAILFFNFPSIISPLAKNFPEVAKLLRSERGSYDLLADSSLHKIAEDFSKWYCQENTIGFLSCIFGYQIICGFNLGGLEVEPRDVANIFQYFASSISGKQLEHFLQLIKFGAFRLFDYHEGNIRVYNSTKPPVYRLENVKAPVYIYNGDCDALVAEKDVDILMNKLPNVRARKTLKNYNHCDYNYGRNARIDIYEQLIKEMITEN